MCDTYKYYRSFHRKATVAKDWRDYCEIKWIDTPRNTTPQVTVEYCKALVFVIVISECVTDQSVFVDYAVDNTVQIFDASKYTLKDIEAEMDEERWCIVTRTILDSIFGNR